MGSEQTGDVVVRCVCGKKYRMRGVKAGTRTTCPDCGSLIEVTEADFSTDFAADGSIKLHEDQVEAQEAVLVGGEPIRLATKGSRPGLTGGIAYTNEEALLSTATSGRAPAMFGDSPTAQLLGDGMPIRPRTFVQDLLASFWFAGNKSNALNVLLTAVPLAVLSLVTSLIPPGFAFLFGILLAVATAIVYAYIIQFFWFVLKMTAKGEDVIPLFDTDWDIIDDVFWPFLWVATISFLCSLPSLLVKWYAPQTPQMVTLSWVVFVAGWFFWPVAVMSVAIGNTIFFLRPDWLVRCIIGIGPSYPIAWLLVMACVLPWSAASNLAVAWLGLVLPPVGVWVVLIVTAPLLAAIDLYLGYVACRMIGLMFRHFRDRFPWRF